MSDKSDVPTRPGEPPFRDLVVRRGWNGAALVEAKRGIAESAERQLRDLEEIHRQIKQKAEEIVASTQRDIALHDVRFTCVRRRGHVYHLYERARDPAAPGTEGEDSQRWFSLLGPADYADADPRARHLGTFRLHYDNTWEEVSE